MKTLSVIFLLLCAGCKKPSPRTSPIVLEDFSTLRSSPTPGSTGSTDLIRAYTPSDATGTSSWDLTNHWYVHHLNAGKKMIADFMPTADVDGNTPYPKGRLSAYIRSGTWSPTVNRLRMWIRCTGSVPFHNGGGATWELGVYVKDNSGTWSNSDAGSHYYHQIDPALYANQWMFLEFNSHPQHNNTENTSDGHGNYPNDPSMNFSHPVHYYDGMTRWYLDTVSNYEALSGGTCNLADLTMGEVSGTPDYEVSTIWATYTGSGYEVGWSGPRNWNHNYSVRYSTSSMKTNGWNSGSSPTTIKGPDSAYTNPMRWTSPNMSQVDRLYVGIMPDHVGSSNNTSQFTEVEIARVPYQSGGGGGGEVPPPDGGGGGETPPSSLTVSYPMPVGGCRVDASYYNWGLTGGTSGACRDPLHQQAVMIFPNTGAPSAVYSFRMPQHWNGGAVNFIFNTANPAGDSQQLKFDAKVGCVADGAGYDAPAFAATASATFSAGAAGKAATRTISGMSTTGCTAGGLAMLQLSRDNTIANNTAHAEYVIAPELRYTREVK